MIVYFIGGSQDLTKRAYPSGVLNSIRYPVMEPLPFLTAGEPNLPVKIETEEYIRVGRIGKDIHVFALRELSVRY